MTSAFKSALQRGIEALLTVIAGALALAIPGLTALLNTCSAAVGAPCAIPWAWIVAVVGLAIIVGALKTLLQYLENLHDVATAAAGPQVKDLTPVGPPNAAGATPTLVEPVATTGTLPVVPEEKHL